MITNQTIQEALSQLLKSLGFEAMARDVIKEQDKETLSKYARIILKNLKDEQLKYKIGVNFKSINLI